MTATDIEAGAAVFAVVITGAGVAGHFVGAYFDRASKLDRLTDAIYGSEGEPGILQRLRQIEHDMPRK